MSDYLNYMTERLGSNWVLARRTSRIIARYGEDVNCVSHKQMRAVERDWRLAHGREYDEPRALMYLALKQIHEHLIHNDNCRAIMTEMARRARRRTSNLLGATNMKDRFMDGHTQRRIDQVRVGDRLDLENDRYADPQGFRGVESDRPEFEFEFEEVHSVKRETDRCIRLDFNNFSVGFPPDHWIDVDGEQKRNRR